LLSKTVRYDGKEYPYPLGLFDDVADVPVKGLAPFPKPGSVRLTATNAGTARGLDALADADVYFSGGPCFRKGTGATILATYPDGSAAVVARAVGKGEVVLIGGHPERPATTCRRPSPPARCSKR